ncbi:MAG: hypothetical protein M1508_12325 [Nitrospirae bacterium]|nr:hypothetical protein [Nitrospirota bacterium]
MLRKILSVTIVAILLTFGGVANAVTLDEAKTQVEKHATDKKLNARERAEAVEVLKGLVEKGVPVEHASKVVDACIDKGIRGKELSNIAKSIESVTPDARDEASDVAAAAITHNYKTEDVIKTVEAVDMAVKDGAKPENAAKVVTMGMDKGLSGDAIKKTAKNYGSEIKKGRSPERAMERSMSMDKDRVRDMDRMGGSNIGRNPGVDTGMGRGADMGRGSVMDGGSGMGGRR